ncbi:hypothetical protein ONZ45_g8590 [Pleurotus djamor]|nr:hypothetical protein ONZ45_g8590 [Pleurotus djamor]
MDEHDVPHTRPANELWNALSTAPLVYCLFAAAGTAAVQSSCLPVAEDGLTQAWLTDCIPDHRRHATCYGLDMRDSLAFVNECNLWITSPIAPPSIPEEWLRPNMICLFLAAIGIAAILPTMPLYAYGKYA